ncbi:hypothetical protein CHO01_10460 [Cellulomonas hominis]|uniref:Ribosomally synthesized peptide with SipW-like signal peptide n=1 Tax=Cellulomonas hominis TaxID=156981 RepID=A0A511F9J5_9CELL|nr:hypothetical protein [Cellulomonas hominis]MBB5473605.1 hypothetical protein [Cellulomonas hominis]GEL45930.1 hypothetical protein CHO01_10460 [Cellulomonas hominis]
MDELLREMITPPPPRRDPARRRRLITTAAILGMAALGMTSLVTSAIFTDRQDAGRTGITTGSVDIEAGEDVAFELPPGFLAPGDDVYSPVTVRNEGSLALVYRVDYAATDTDGKALAAQLGMTLYAAATCSVDGVAGAEVVAEVPSLSTGTQPLVTDARSLYAGTSEALCVRVTVPESLGDAFQEATTDLKFTFLAEQAPDPHAR